MQTYIYNLYYIYVKNVITKIINLCKQYEVTYQYQATHTMTTHTMTVVHTVNPNGAIVKIPKKFIFSN